MNRTKRILLSLALVGAVAAAVGLGSAAFFSDTETSTDNVLQAGSIDLLIDNHSWYYGPDGLVERQDLSWEATNLDGHLFFNYRDMKPGDWGEDTVSIRVNDNDSWLCADLYVTRDDDMSSAEPELDIGDAVEDPQNPWDGELAEDLFFVFWVDDGDNVYECDNELNDTDNQENGIIDDRCEEILTLGYADNAVEGLHYTLADSLENNLGGVDGEPAVGEQTYYIGKYWCFGNVESNFEIQDGLDNVGPDKRGSGWNCYGDPVDNWSQSDQVTADVSFYAVQSRHNNEFVCEQFYTPEAMTRLRLENKTEAYDPILGDGVYGILDFTSANSTFDYNLEVFGLQPSTEYHLHYYADPWPSTLGIAIDTFTTDASGNWSGSGSVELNTDLPVAGDVNPSAKIWVIPTSHWGGTGTGMTNWDQTQYLWEWNLVSYDDTDA